jgi:hypothetical protein
MCIRYPLSVIRLSVIRLSVIRVLVSQVPRVLHNLFRRLSESVDRYSALLLQNLKRTALSYRIE